RKSKNSGQKSRFSALIRGIWASRYSGFNLNFPWFFAHFRLAVCVMAFFFGADFSGSVQAVFFAETQLCEFAFLKAVLLAERVLSLVW
ncbi:TPA: hypothetical protein NJ352_004537, partial [Vibrio parahaemolyticus]|nr:hypothetical protein [Vibrio parahaemolyticus]HCG8084942.1 hypothetical protein [Vibrio parahaemolyticus]